MCDGCRESKVFPIRIIRALLDREHGSSSFAALSRIQSSAVVDLATKCQPDAGAACELAEVVLSISWACNSDRDSVLDALAARTPAKKRFRRALQDFKSFPQYFTAEQWGQLQDETLASPCKLTMLLSHCSKLGLRLPTEGTLKLLASLWTVMSESPIQIARSHPEQKTQLLA
jgi:hypothetical protein